MLKSWGTGWYTAEIIADWLCVKFLPTCFRRHTKDEDMDTNFFKPLTESQAETGLELYDKAGRKAE